jgi:hypothetical protein
LFLILAWENSWKFQEKNTTQLRNKEKNKSHGYHEISILTIKETGIRWRKIPYKWKKNSQIRTEASGRRETQKGWTRKN